MANHAEPDPDTPDLLNEASSIVVGTSPAPGGPWAQAWHGISRVAKIVGEMIYGASIYEMVRDLNKERGMIERLFILAVFGDVLGVPILPPYYALRLLPYVVPKIEGWRRSMFRERDLTDLCDQEFT